MDLVKKSPTLSPSFSQEPEVRAGEEKMLQILDGARKVFLADGFDGASMNDIAKMAGVSKGTLYVYFDSKQALFEALIRRDRRRQAEQLFAQLDPGEPGEVLRQFGMSFMTALTHPDHIAHMRVVIAAAAKFPQIGRAFYEAGPAFGLQKLADYLAQEVEAGRLVIEDTEFAATQFVELCQAGSIKKLFFCLTGEVSPDTITRSVEGAVAMFLTFYSRR